jgi:hypothetical protein
MRLLGTSAQKLGHRPNMQPASGHCGLTKDIRKSLLPKFSKISEKLFRKKYYMLFIFNSLRGGCLRASKACAGKQDCRNNLLNWLYRGTALTSGSEER